MIRLLSILAFIAYGEVVGAQSDSLDYSDAFTIMNVWLDGEKDYHDFPGLSAALIKDQEVIWNNSFGFSNPNEGVKAETNTIYSICSISKLFTAIAVMQLRDSGKLSLEDPIEKLLPWFDLQRVHEDSEPITVRSLLTHSSGLPRESNHPYWTGPNFPFPTKEEIKAQLKHQETLYPASTYFQYSNLGLTLLGAIVEEVSGQDYESYINENILDPLGLTDTRTHLPRDKYGAQLAIGFSSLDREGKRNSVNLFQGKGIAAAAGFSSTVEDLGKFASWQFRLLKKGGREIVKAPTLKEMQRVHFLDPNWETSWGLGFSVRKNNGNIQVGHGGSCPGYRSQLILVPKKKLASVVMFNASGINTRRYANGLLAILDKVNESPGDSNDLAPYLGIYNVQPWGGEEVVAQLNNQLVLFALPNNNPANSMTRLKHMEGDTFRRIRDDDELGETIVFKRDSNGNVTHFVQHNNFYYRLRALED